MTKCQHILQFLPAVILTVLPGGCQSSPSAAIQGDYTLEAQSVQINGIIINLGDWPGCSVTVTDIDGESAEVTVDSLLLGFDELSLPCKVTEEGKHKFSFTGDYEGNDRDISLSGNVNKGRLTLSITDVVTSPVAGRWLPATDENGLPDLDMEFSSPLVTDDSLVLQLENAAKAFLASELSGLEYLELDRTGYLNIEPLLEGIIQYYPEPAASSVHIYLRRTLTDGLGLPVSPMDIALTYSISGDNMTLRADKECLEPWVSLITGILGGYTYSDYISAGNPLGEMTEEEFNEMKSILTLVSGVLEMPATDYSLNMTFTNI